MSELLQIVEPPNEEIPPELENDVELIFRDMNAQLLETTFPADQIEALRICLENNPALAVLYEGQYQPILTQLNEILPVLAPDQKSLVLAFFAQLLKYSIAGTETESISESFFSNILGAICSLLADSNTGSNLPILIPALKCMHYYARHTKNIKEFSNEISFKCYDSNKRNSPITLLLDFFDKLHPLDPEILAIRQLNGSQIPPDENINEISRLIWKFLNAYLNTEDIPMGVTPEIIDTLMKHLSAESATEEIREYIFRAALNAALNERSYMNFFTSIKNEAGYGQLINLIDADLGKNITCPVLIIIKTILKRHPGEALELLQLNFLEHLLKPFHSDDPDICINAIQLFIEFINADSVATLEGITQTNLIEGLYQLTEVSTHQIKIAAFSALSSIIQGFDFDSIVEFVTHCPEILERTFIMIGSELPDDEFCVLNTIAMKLVETYEAGNQEELANIVMETDIISTLDLIIDNAGDNYQLHSIADRLQNILRQYEQRDLP